MLSSLVNSKNTFNSLLNPFWLVDVYGKNSRFARDSAKDLVFRIRRNATTLKNHGADAAPKAVGVGTMADNATAATRGVLT